MKLFIPNIKKHFTLPSCILIPAPKFLFCHLMLSIVRNINHELYTRRDSAKCVRQEIIHFPSYVILTMYYTPDEIVRNVLDNKPFILLVASASLKCIYSHLFVFRNAYQVHVV